MTLRTGLTEQAVAARMAMLSQAELGEIYADARHEAAAVDAAQARMMAAGAREQQQEATAPESASEAAASRPATARA